MEKNSQDASDDYIACLTIYGLPVSAERVAVWLREMASIISDGEDLSGPLTMKLMQNRAHGDGLQKWKLSLAARDRLKNL